MAKILLVEDNEFNSDMLIRRLTKKGYETVLAVNGEEAINMAKSATPDLILMDMNLPVVDGWEATQTIKTSEQTSTIPIIGLSAHAMDAERERAREAGCDDYDTKPVDFKRLLQKIESFLA